MTDIDISGLQLFSGHLLHVRNTPAIHRFSYRISNIWLDVSRPELIDQLSPFWSSSHPNLVRYRRDNYLPGRHDLYEQVCETLYEHAGTRFGGKIYLLANLSYWGICYNPVSFYFCYTNDGSLAYILSEIHNTPWRERFTYVHTVPQPSPAQQSQAIAQQENSECDHTFKFKKQFHVSPYVPMDVDYHWRFKIQGSKIAINMNLLQDGQSIFNSQLRLTATPLTRTQATLIPFRFPLMCVKVFTAIYWNAFKLWLKRTPIYDHP